MILNMRRLILNLLALTPYRHRLFDVVRYQVGVIGCGPTDLDKPPSRPINRFERWLTRDVVLELKTIHRKAFREACIEVTGEDPEVDW